MPDPRPQPVTFPHRKRSAMNLSSYRKSLAMLAVTVLHAAIAIVSDSDVTESEWRAIAATVLGNFLVYVVRNHPYPDPQNRDGVV